MKFLVITTIKEFEKEVAKLLHEAGIAIFSVTETVGHKDHKNNPMLDNWFSHGEAKFDSLFIFSFTPEAQADRAMELVQQFNQKQAGAFPVHTFVLPVEKWNP